MNLLSSSFGCARILIFIIDLLGVACFCSCITGCFMIGVVVIRVLFGWLWCWEICYLILRFSSFVELLKCSLFYTLLVLSLSWLWLELDDDVDVLFLYYLIFIWMRGIQTRRYLIKMRVGEIFMFVSCWVKEANKNQIE